MKKTTLLTSLAALALVLGLGACETNTDAGDVTTGGDESSSDTTDTGTSEPDDNEKPTPEEDEPLTEEELAIAKNVLQAAVSASTTGYNSFKYLDYYSFVRQGGGQTTVNTYSITLDSNNKIYGLRRIYDEDATKESDAKFHYLVEGVDYYYNGSLPSPSYTYTNLNYNAFNTLISANVGSGYNGAFDNVSSIDLDLASGLRLETEDSGNYKITFTYQDLWYVYKADTNFNLVGAGYYTDLDLGDYASDRGYEFAYGELTTQERIDKVMESFDITLWIPDTSGDEQTNAEKALEFIESVETKTENLTNISWDAFHYYDVVAGGLFDE